MATFSLNGKEFEYFNHDYNTTWNNERAVEIPVILDIVDREQERRVLEVGNVLSHYVSFSHDVVDKYEAGNGVRNMDVVDLDPRNKYDLIIAISTLEHVGWDEEKKDPEKIMTAIERLRSCLSAGGQLLVTLPLGYNPPMDEMLDRGLISLDKTWCLKRISADNRWEQVSWSEIRECRYGDPYPAANGLVIGVIRGKKERLGDRLKKLWKGS